MTKAAELAKIGEVATNSQLSGGRRNISYQWCNASGTEKHKCYWNR